MSRRTAITTAVATVSLVGITALAVAVAPGDTAPAAKGRGRLPEALAAAVLRFLRRRERYAPEALRRFAVEHYPWERTVAATEEIYREVLGGRGG